MSAVPYVVPFATFFACMGLRAMGLTGLAEQVLWNAILIAAIALVSRRVLDFGVRNWAGTIAMGIAVFVVWIVPDLAFPGYRSHWLFSNSIMGSVGSGLAESVRSDSAILLLRGMRAALLVPIVEELFWRSWLMRWLIRPDFENVPLGTYAAGSFWPVALLFAAEHGPYWDVGLAAGILYNWWMVRTKSLGDLILAHGITNACLSAYVVAAGKWEYWA